MSKRNSDQSLSEQNTDKNSLFQDIQRGVNHLKSCPVCAEDYKEPQFDVIFERGNVRVVHILCNSCQHKVVTLLATTSFGMSSLGMTTDLSADDFVRTAHLDPLTEDDVLQFHTFLHKHHKTFVNLLSK